MSQLEENLKKYGLKLEELHKRSKGDTHEVKPAANSQERPSSTFNDQFTTLPLSMNPPQHFQKGTSAGFPCNLEEYFRLSQLSHNQMVNPSHWFLPVPVNPPPFAFPHQTNIPTHQAYQKSLHNQTEAQLPLQKPTDVEPVSLKNEQGTRIPAVHCRVKSPQNISLMSTGTWCTLPESQGVSSENPQPVLLKPTSDRCCEKTCTGKESIDLEVSAVSAPPPPIDEALCHSNISLVAVPFTTGCNAKESIGTQTDPSQSTCHTVPMHSSEVPQNVTLTPPPATCSTSNAYPKGGVESGIQEEVCHSGIREAPSRALHQSVITSLNDKGQGGKVFSDRLSEAKMDDEVELLSGILNESVTANKASGINQMSFSVFESDHYYYQSDDDDEQIIRDVFYI